MKLHHFLLGSSAVLSALLGVQVTAAHYQSQRLANSEAGKVHYHASWVRKANSLDAAARFSNQIALGRVINIRRGPDIVVAAPIEPGGEDRIPVEVVTLRLERSYKGGKPETIQVFHTGLSTASQPQPLLQEEGPENQPLSNQPPGPRGNLERPVSIEDDPPYRVGERYLMFLTEGPIVDGTTTQALIAPEGRYRVTANNRLQAITDRGLARSLEGTGLDRVEQLLQQLPAAARQSASPGPTAN